jgi:hypothetical protein
MWTDDCIVDVNDKLDVELCRDETWTDDCIIDVNDK